MPRRSFNLTYAKSFFIAAGLHAILLFGGGWALSHKAEFGMETGRASIEIEMVAAPLEKPPVEAPAEVRTEPQVEPVITPPAPDDFVVPAKVEEKIKPVSEEQPRIVEEKPKLVVKNEDVSSIKGDGSSPNPGKDVTTLHSSGGAVAEAKPDYLKNPAPAYPETSRRLGQEGTTILLVEVTSQGEPRLVQIKTSSGFRLLDDAALKAVRRWKFSPARMGSVAIDSQAEVPVRFVIK